MKKTERWKLYRSKVEKVTSGPAPETIITQALRRAVTTNKPKRNEHGLRTN